MINLLKAIPLSFYSKALYREVRQSWKGRSFIYLLILLAICWLAITITGVIYLSQSRAIGDRINYLSNQMPTIQFQSGTAFTTKPGPFFIKHQPDAEELFLIIDTTNKPQTLEHFKKSSARILIFQDTIQIKKRNEITIHHFSKDLSGRFGPNEFKEVLQKMRNTLIIIGILLYPVILFILYIYHILQSLLYALIGLLFASMFQHKIEYSALMSLAMVAITPTIILCTIIALSSPAILPHALVWSFILSAGYVFFAVKSNAEISENR